MCRTQLLPLLQELDLSDNYLRQLHDFSFFQCLRCLNLAGNKLSSCRGLGRLPCLISLDLSKNRILWLLAVLVLWITSGGVCGPCIYTHACTSGGVCGLCIYTHACTSGGLWTLYLHTCMYLWWFMDLVFTHMHVPLVEFMYLVFTHMPGESYRRRLRSLFLCDIFQAPMNFLVSRERDIYVLTVWRTWARFQPRKN